MGRERQITPREIYTGGQHERDYLWEINYHDPKFIAEVEKRKQPSKNPAFEYFMSFRDALELAKKFQPIDKTDPKKRRVDPTNPQAPLLRDLRVELIDQMGLSYEQADQLKLYTSVGSPLDWLHGTDAFIDYNDKIITLDLTLKPTAEGKKADVIITGDLPAPDDPETEDEYLDKIEEIAKSVRTVIKLKGRPARPQIQKLYKEDRPAA